MYREITRKLTEWKDDTRRKPLLITGVRQCGKTYAINEFGKEYFNDVLKINFESHPGLNEIFDYDLDPKRIVRELELTTKQKIVSGKTLLFFDEIQECPKAITSLKYFCEDLKELHVIGAGSLLGVALNNKALSFPVGKVNRMQLYPMNFREFLIASGENELLELLSGWSVKRSIPEHIKGKMERLLKHYFIVGGMPEAVKVWKETGDLEKVEQVQKEILDDYADDFSKHAPISEVPKIRWIWDSIPVQLSKENRKFVFSHVKEGKRWQELEDGLQWLKNAGLIYQLELVDNPEIPLSSCANKTYFKVYLADVGLLRSRAGLSADAIMSENIHFTRFKGALSENYVYQELISQGKEPFFWRSGNTAELDFIYEDNDGIVPVEVKSADNSQAKSYKMFCEKYNPGYGFKLTLKNIGENICVNTKTVNLPLYMVWDIDNY